VAVWVLVSVFLTACFSGTQVRSSQLGGTLQPTLLPEQTPKQELGVAVSVPPQSSSLTIPPETKVVRGSCSSDGECHWYNFYWAPTHEAVVQEGESQIKVEHELCHAHQHWSINGGALLPPDDYDLHTWYDTAEGKSFFGAASGLSWLWSHSAVNDLEDFAWTCAYWYLGPVYLNKISPQRYDWAAANLTK